MKVLKYLDTRQRVLCAVLMLLSCFSAYAATRWPAELGILCDNIAAGNITDLTGGLAPILRFAAIFLAAEVLSIIRRASTDMMTIRFEHQLRVRGIGKILHLPSSFFFSEESGEYADKTCQSIRAGGALLRNICNNMFPTLLVSLFALIRAIREAPGIIPFIMILYVIVNFLVCSSQIRSQNAVRRQIFLDSARLNGAVAQSIRAIESIRVTNAERQEQNRIGAISEKVRKTAYRHHMIMSGYDISKHVIKTLFLAGMMIASVVGIQQGRITAGTALSMIMLFRELMGAADSVHVCLDEMAENHIRAKEIDTTLSAPEDSIFRIHMKNLLPVHGVLSIRDLTIYTPDNRRTIRENLNMKIRSGAVTALSGKTGCGKSSLLKALMRFYPSAGDIFYGGVSLDKISQEHLCHRVCSLTQEPLIIQGTIRDNLVYGLENDPGDTELNDALKKALIYDELCQKDPDVLNLPVSENGSNYSGGQKQRIALARAFLHEPDWYFLDEATAALDVGTATRVMKNLIRHARHLGTGILLITHQPEINALCDETIEL